MGERAVLVGGGGGALGGAVVDVFLARGERVVVPWIVEAERAALAARCADALAQERLVLVEADVADDAGARAAVAAAGAGLGAVICGVGGFAGGAPVAETGLEVWDRLYRINLRTAVSTCRAAAPVLRARGSGAIVLVASQAALDCPAGLAAYSASKAAVIALARTLANELRPDGVRVNAIVPTTIDTPANRAAMPDADTSAWTPPAAIAATIDWLCSDAARNVSGGLIPV